MQQSKFLAKAIESIKTLKDGPQKAQLLSKVAELTWESDQKAQADRLLKQAYTLIAKIEGKDAIPAWLSISTSYQKMGIPSKAKQSLDKAWLLVKETPISNRSASYQRGLLPNVLMGYAKLGIYSQALIVAQAETDLQEQKRLTELVQCATAQ